jgi:hypothetical protein
MLSGEVWSEYPTMPFGSSVLSRDWPSIVTVPATFAVPLASSALTVSTGSVSAGDLGLGCRWIVFVPA